MPRRLMLDVDGVLVTGRPEDGRHWAEDLERDLSVAPDERRARLLAPHRADIVVGRRDPREALAACRPEPAVSVERHLGRWLGRAALAEVDRLRARAWPWSSPRTRSTTGRAT